MDLNNQKKKQNHEEKSPKEVPVTNTSRKVAHVHRLKGNEQSPTGKEKSSKGGFET